MTERDELREFAQALVPDEDLILSRGKGALAIAFSRIATDTIMDVYADCGDSDARVLGSNVGKMIGHAVAAQLSTFRRPRVIETADELDKLGYRAVILDVFGDALVCMRKNLRGTWWKYPTAEGECSPAFILDLGPATVLWEGGE
ncbi:hypothetical protein C6401_15320 [Arthrobacter woluwensis]|uniref:hypothetical protein n=1 Tax=Arthrobacter woluwensis TaxID=156980 RepID=UPI000D139B58|nr:hypothetical protein [Arthrobacter woluwensis]PSS42925.1 hypothetical protein C6401_15320 [Arthrobacter woluwensis]